MITALRPTVRLKYVYALAAGLPCLYLSYALINVWLDPMAWDNGRWVPYGVGLLLMEFLVLHSAGMTCGILSTRQADKQANEDAAIKAARDRYKLLAGLFAMYCLLGFGFAMSTDSPSLLAMLIAIMVGRFVNVLDGDQSQALSQRTAAGVVLYLLCAAGTIFIAVPEMGITREVLAEVYPSRGGGIWERFPQRPIVAGAVYFGLMGVLELFVFPSKADR